MGTEQSNGKGVDKDCLYFQSYPPSSFFLSFFRYLFYLLTSVLSFCLRRGICPFRSYTTEHSISCFNQADQQTVFLLSRQAGKHIIWNNCTRERYCHINRWQSKVIFTKGFAYIKSLLTSAYIEMSMKCLIVWKNFY